MKTILKLTLYLFLMIFSLSVNSQFDYIKNYKYQIDYFENEYSYESHVYQKDIDLCRSSIGYRGIIKKITKTGNRQYDILFFNAVNSEYGNVSINYLGKQKPSLEEFENYKKMKIKSYKILIKKEEDKLIAIEKRRLAKIEYQKKEKKFIITEQENLRKRLDSILNEINDHIEGSNSYYPVIKSFDSMYNKTPTLKWILKEKIDSLFNIPVKFINTFLEDRKKINSRGETGYFPEEDQVYLRSYEVVPDNFICCDRDIKVSSSSSKGYRTENFGDKIETIFTMFRIIQNFRSLNEMGLDDSYGNKAASLKRFFLFHKFIEKERLFEVLNTQINYFNYEDVDTLGFSDTGRFKWVGEFKNTGIGDFKTTLPIISRLFRWYENEFDLIERKGLKYDRFLKEEMPSGEDYEHILKKQPSEYILQEIYKQYDKMHSYIEYFESFNYLRFDDYDLLDDVIMDFNNIISLGNDLTLIKEFDDFIILDFKPLFQENYQYGVGLRANKNKQMKKIYDQINQKLNEKEKTIHFNLIGDYIGYSVESPIKFFYDRLHYGYRVSEGPPIYGKFPDGRKVENVNEYRIQNLYEFFNFINYNGLNSIDFNNYIKKMKSIINEFK